MSKILTSYAVNVDPLPPEGSEEWLAMLPGWTGWRYSMADNSVGIYRDNNTLYSINFDGYSIAYYTTSGALGAICRTSSMEKIIIGSYTIYKACDDIPSNLPKYYVKGNDVRETSGVSGDWYAVAGVNSLTIE